nr:tetraspanin-32-like [Chrysemys picta bellii]
MGRRHWVRTTKCQLLVTSLFVMLLGLAVTILTIITRYGAHFSIISGVSSEANPYRIFHNVAFYSGICLSMILVLAALLSTVATVRESVCLMAMVSVCLEGHGWAGNSFSKLGDNTMMWRYREEALSVSSLLLALGLSTIKCDICSVD